MFALLPMLGLIGGMAVGAVAVESAWGWSAPRPARRPSVQGRLGRLSIGEAEALLAGGLVGLNRYQLRVMGVPPISAALHEGRVVYDRHDPEERWLSIREIWEAGDGIAGPVGVGRGDCEDLAAAVAAERTEAGYPSTIEIWRVRDGLSHAVVRDLTTGEAFDPSLTGGMGWTAEHRARFGLVDGPAPRTSPPRPPWLPPRTTSRSW